MKIRKEDYRNPSWIRRNEMQRKYENWKRGIEGNPFGAEGIIVIGREALLELKEKNVMEVLKLEEDYRGLFEMKKEHREEVLELEFRIIDNFGVEGEEW